MDVAAKVTSKGQVTVPKAVREALGIVEGDEVIFRVEGDRAMLARTPDFLARGFDSCAGGEAQRRLGRRDPPDQVGSRHVETLSSFVDTNVLIRHLTGDPPALAARATAYLGAEQGLLLTDLVAAETVYVLESFYETPRDRVAQAMQSLVAFDSIICVDPALLLRAIEVYEADRLDFAEAYLVACAESTGVGKVTSFDRSLDRVETIERVEPPPV